MLEHTHFRGVGDYLNPGDILVFNQTRVIPARLHGEKAETGGKIELLLLRPTEERTWKGLIGGRNVHTGARLVFTTETGERIKADVVAEGERAERFVRFDEPIAHRLEEFGEVPLPPYIHQPLADPERYQTVYARDPGSAAAPTAGLHFTGDLLISLKRSGVHLAFCTLHVGLDTFQPVQEEDISEHTMHSERILLTPANAKMINAAKLAGGRIIAVGTTSVRVLETAALKSAGITDPYADKGDFCPWRPVTAVEGETDLFIRPGYKFRGVDALITNFHLPQSTLLMLVSALAGRERILTAYNTARDKGYRFYSFGDAMLIV
jgi:S-adenosylmethionine:tRNA ribosyltransferase-isomerase